MNIYLVIILTFYIGMYALGLFVEYLNLKEASSELPKEFEGVYSAEDYQKSQDYLKENTRFSLIQETFSMGVTVPFILWGGFNVMDMWVRTFQLGPIETGVLFFFTLMLLSQILSFPFSLYQTFVIEAKYGFNKTTFKLFMVDLVKGVGLLLVLGGPISWCLLWFFESTQFAWLWAWLFLTGFSLVMMVVAPVVIMPLFNKFEPLKEGELKTSIETYVKEQRFGLKGVFTMDGSKRSSKANAFFTGLGKFRRIVLFDTLIENHTVQELVAIIAHEMGHLKRKHIQKGLLLSVFSNFLMFYVLSLFIKNPELFSAFKMENLSVYASLIFFGFLFSPIQTLLGIVGKILSRKYEYEADAFAATSTKDAQPLISGLKTLSKDNLSNLTPHSLKVFLEYSHPPVLKRIEALKKLS